jgi:hypothetical protein
MLFILVRLPILCYILHKSKISPICFLYFLSHNLYFLLSSLATICICICLVHFCVIALYLYPTPPYYSYVSSSLGTLCTCIVCNAVHPFKNPTLQSEEFTSITPNVCSFAILCENFTEVSTKEPMLVYPKDIPDDQTFEEYYFMYQKDGQESLVDFLIILSQNLLGRISVIQIQIWMSQTLYLTVNPLI